MQRVTWVLVATHLLTGAQVWARTPSFQGLGDLPGGGFGSRASGVSPGGDWVVGYAVGPSGYEAFRWTWGGPMEGLGRIPGDWQSFGTDVSADGSVVAGTSMGSGGTTRACRWTAQTGMVWLGEIYPGDSQGWAYGLSGDGSVVVGTNAQSTSWEAFRWTESTGMVGLGDLPGGFTHSRARAISTDGTTIVGSSVNSVDSTACRWQGAAPESLGYLASRGRPESYALDVSSDGSVVVGYSGPSEDREAFRWTAASGMVGLGDLPGGLLWSEAKSVSADGSVIVGMGHSDGHWEAFIWDPDDGMRRLADVLVADCRLDLTGWTLKEATGISDDGQVIVGWGRSPAGDEEAFVAVIPEPSVALLAGLGLPWLLRRRRCCATAAAVEPQAEQSVGGLAAGGPYPKGE